jgi:ketosteroid isomerase-like protein
MSETATPREVFQKLHTGITTGVVAGLAELYAEDAVVEIVFDPAGRRRIEGREALRERFAQVGDSLPFQLTSKNLVIRETDDPEVIVAEYDYLAKANGVDRTFEAANIQVVRVRDGLVVHSRDFHDHVGFFVGGGRTAELVKLLESR